MKVFKKVLILSLAILSLSSSVAFGECQIAKSSDTGVATVAPKGNAQANSANNNGQTNAGALGQAGAGNGNGGN